MCEFIEDCEFTALSTQVLHVLGEEGPRTASASKYIRYIYNRLILESSAVRAAAVDALAKFGVQCTTLRDSVCVLLKRCAQDSDDEVRDRAALLYHIISSMSPAVASQYLLNPVPASLPVLEQSLLGYVDHPEDESFDISTVPVEQDVQPAGGANGESWVIHCKYVSHSARG